MVFEGDSDDDVPLALVVSKKIGIDEQVNQSSNISFPEIGKEKPPDEIASNHQIVHTLFEYEWPKKRCGNFFVIEEDLLKFLDVSSIKNTVHSRKVMEEEASYISKLGYTISSQSDLKAIPIEDACEFMAEYYPDKFKLYLKQVHQSEMRKMVRKQEAQRIDVIKGKIPNIMKRSLRETVRYNSMLNRERQEERCAYFDLQTQIIHLPQKKRKYDPTHQPNLSLYPVALIPGQYQDYYKRYSPEDLKRLPLNTVTLSLHQKETAREMAEAVNIGEDAEKMELEDELESIGSSDAKSQDEDSKKKKTKNGKDPFCGICMKGPEMNKRGLPEKLIHCSQCENSGHPSCLDMNRHIVAVIQGYPWQCMECKICTECLAPHDEEAMMFCDNCDRGYHSYCVGLKEIPKGRWVCERCGKCCSCLTRRPVPEGESGRWKNEQTKPANGGEGEFLQIHCHDCSKLFRKGSFCPVCLKVYRAAEDHINPMVCCDRCDRWIHTDCDGIDEQRYNELSKDHRALYTCILCRGEKEERMDAFHKNNR